MKRGTQNALVWVGFVAVLAVGTTAVVAREVSQLEELSREIPWCPGAGLYSWHGEVSEYDLEDAQAILAKRNWTGIHYEDSHKISRDVGAGVLGYVYFYVVSARCIPGVYDPASGRIMEAA